MDSITQDSGKKILLSVGYEQSLSVLELGGSHPLLVKDLTTRDNISSIKTISHAGQVVTVFGTFDGRVNVLGLH